MVVPNEQMRRDVEKIDRMYVQLTGRFLATPTADGSVSAAIKDILAYSVWSDPSHPIGLRENPTKPK